MSVSASSGNKTLDMVYISMFAVLLAICSWIIIPSTVPFTLQTFGIFVAAGTLGGRRGTAAILIYLLLGAVGIPVFSGFTGGVGILLGNTGGYIVGFLFSVLLMWGMETVFGKKNCVLAVSMVLGLLVCYIFGTIWFMIAYTTNAGETGLWAALGFCVFPFIIPDIAKITLALLICKRLRNVIK